MSINDTAAMPPNEWNADQSVEFLNVGKREEGAATSIWFFLSYENKPVNV